MGTTIALSIAAMHRRKDLWGEDADEFCPERWTNEKPAWVSFVVSLSCSSRLQNKRPFSHPSFREHFKKTGANKPWVLFRSSSLLVVAPEFASVVNSPSSSLVPLPFLTKNKGLRNEYGNLHTRAPRPNFPEHREPRDL